MNAIGGAVREKQSFLWLGDVLSGGNFALNRSQSAARTTAAALTTMSVNEDQRPVLRYKMVNRGRLGKLTRCYSIGNVICSDG